SIPECSAGATPLVTIALARGGVIAGQVAFPRGSAPQRVMVSVRTEDDDFPVHFGHDDVVTGTDGRFRFDSLPPGRYEVDARTLDDKGVLSASSKVETDVENLLLTLSDAASKAARESELVLRIVDTEGNPVAGGQVADVAPSSSGTQTF